MYIEIFKCQYLQLYPKTGDTVSLNCYHGKVLMVKRRDLPLDERINECILILACCKFLSESWHVDEYLRIFIIPSHVIFANEGFNLVFDHGWICLKHCNVLNHLKDKVLHSGSFVGFHDLDNFRLNHKRSLLPDPLLHRHFIGCWLKCHLLFRLARDKVTPH